MMRRLMVMAIGLSVWLALPWLLSASRQADLVIYDDSTTWDDWSWNSAVHFAHPSHTHSGANSIAITYTQAWAGLSLRNATPVNTSGYTAIVFWVYGGAGDSQLNFTTQITESSAVGPAYAFTVPASVWTGYTVTLATLGNPATIARINIQDATGATQPTFYVDDIRLSASTTTPPPASSAVITLTIDVAANRKPISPYIYGMHYVTEAFAAEIELPVRRWGGNDTTRYNWTINAYNHASDYYFENDSKDMSADQFIDRDRSANTKTIMTLPLIGWTPKDASLDTCAYRITKYGAQTGSDPYRPDCGNGIRLSNSQPITTNDPTDTSIAITTSFVIGWLKHLTQTYGAAANGGVLFYNLDNEPDIWFETHRDVFPRAWKYAEFRERTYAYASAIKATDPTAKTLGPVSMGWTYYFHSPYDGQRNDWTEPDDRNAHGGMPFVPWYLQQLRAYEQITGTRILDYLDLHYYPQAAGVSLSSAGNAATQALRLRATRSLWDATYVDESWIATAGPDGGIICLIPRMQEWVNANYTGTRLAITEYNWGALDHINGALAQADVLGIFGREGLDLATLFDTPYGNGGVFTPNSPGAFAFRMYRNYDGAHSKFGDISVRATSSDEGRLSIYAAQHSTDHSLTLMLINKAMTTSITATVSIANFAAATSAPVYRYSEANLHAIMQLPDQALNHNTFTANFPANSITLVRVPLGIPLNNKVYLPLVIR
jgi:hypothetical protein